MRWQPIDSAPRSFSRQIICSHVDKKWIRIGRFYPEVGRWYYSGTNERSQFAQVEGDEPTHWMPLPSAPDHDDPGVSA